MPLVVTMRTPGNDFELAVGFCVTEGVITGPDDVELGRVLRRARGRSAVQRRHAPRCAARSSGSLRERRFVSTASCGLCGKTALDDVEVRCGAVGTRTDGGRVGRSLAAGPARRGAGRVRRDRRAARGRDLPRRRHAGVGAGRRRPAQRVDKLVGEALLARQLPLSERIVMVSGRLSFELVQKAAVAGIPILCAVSAPSSLAVKTAERFGQTVVGFLRDERFNVYSHPERVAVDR